MKGNHVILKLELLLKDGSMKHSDGLALASSEDDEQLQKALTYVIAKYVVL